MGSNFTTNTHTVDCTHPVYTPIQCSEQHYLVQTHWTSSWSTTMPVITPKFETWLHATSLPLGQATVKTICALLQLADMHTQSMLTISFYLCHTFQNSISGTFDMKTQVTYTCTKVCSNHSRLHYKIYCQLLNHGSGTTLKPGSHVDNATQHNSTWLSSVWWQLQEAAFCHILHLCLARLHNWLGLSCDILVHWKTTGQTYGLMPLPDWLSDRVELVALWVYLHTHKEVPTCTGWSWLQLNAIYRCNW